jgi:hypothetical protein
MNRKNIARAVVATGASAALVVLGGGSANAVVVDPASTGITLDTGIAFSSSGTSLVVTADGTFTSTFIENTTLALQVVGTETWTDANGTHTAPLDATPTSIQFSSVNHVQANFALHANAIVQVSYTAQIVGLAPTPFTGSCAGTGVQLSPGNDTYDKTC